MRFWKSYICSNKLDVSEANLSFAQFNRIRNHISLDAGLRLDGVPALDLRDLIVAILHGNTNQSNQARRDLCTNLREVRAVPHKLEMRKKSHVMIDDLNSVDFISSNVQSSHQEALLYEFEDIEAVIKMIIKGRSPTMRHVSRTYRVALDWLFDRISLDPNISHFSFTYCLEVMSKRTQEDAK